jgi:hypothetical protein
MKSSLHSLIPLLPLFCNCHLRRLPQLSAATANSGTQLSSNSSCVRSSLYCLGAPPTENTASTIVACQFTAAEMCLPHHCVATRVARTYRERRSSIFARVRFRGNVFTEPLTSSELFRLSGVMSQYESNIVLGLN